MQKLFLYLFPMTFLIFQRNQIPKFYALQRNVQQDKKIIILEIRLNKFNIQHNRYDFK